MKNLFSTNQSAGGADISILMMRIGISLMMLAHGIPKIGRLGEEPVQFLDFLGLGTTVSLALAVFGEVICSVFVLLGLGTRLAVIPSIITMLVVVFHVHSADGFAKQELGLHYILVYLVLLVLGSGKYSVDHLLFAGRRSRLQPALA